MTKKVIITEDAIDFEGGISPDEVFNLLSKAIWTGIQAINQQNPEEAQRYGKYVVNQIIEQNNLKM